MTKLLFAILTLGTILLVSLVSCQKEEKDQTSDPTSTATHDDMNARTGMETALNNMGVYNNALANATHASQQHHYDSLYHHHDSLFNHHHNTHHHGDVNHHHDHDELHYHHVVDSLHQAHVPHHP
jgi:hypothetical protein